MDGQTNSSTNKLEEAEHPVTPVTIVFKPRIPVVEIVSKLFSFKLLAIFAIALGTLYFQIINHFLPDPLSQVTDGYSYYSSFYGRYVVRIIHYSMSAVIVTLPAYLALVVYWTRKFTNNPDKPESRITKWSTHFILIIAASVIVGDLMGLFYNFLEGEFASRIILKALVIAVIAGAVIGFYVLERLKIEYKRQFSTFILWLPLAVLIVMGVMGIVLGFASAGSPASERARKFDSDRVSDLRQLSSGIDSFARTNNRLPYNLEELKNDSRYGYYTRGNDQDPETQEEYVYRINSDALRSGGKGVYELCATFSLSSDDWSQGQYPYDYSASYNDIWSSYTKGLNCKQKEINSAVRRNTLQIDTVPSIPGVSAIDHQ